MTSTMDGGQGGTASVWARRRAQLRLGVRMIVACLATFLLAHLLGFTQGYWAVLTAVIVMQASVGAAMKASLDRFVGSLGGAIWGVLVSVLVPHGDVWGLAEALAFAVAPLAMVVAFQPAYRVAPVTAIILLLTPGSQLSDPLIVAVHRLTEIALGSLVAIVVSLLVLPARAHNLAAEAAGKALAVMDELTSAVLAGLDQPLDAARVQALHDQLRRTIAQADAAALEAVQERSRWLTASPDPEPLCRTLRRARNDLAMLGRALVRPFEEPVRSRLEQPTRDVSREIAAFCRAAAASLARQASAPSLEPVKQALTTYALAIADLRARGLMRALPDEEVGRVFSLTFALEQFGQNLADLVDRIGELARTDRT